MTRDIRQADITAKLLKLRAKANRRRFPILTLASQADRATSATTASQSQAERRING